jgi:CheY-like chemotaxis protein
MRQNNKPIIILTAEDDPEDRMMIKSALEEARIIEPIYFVSNGEDLLRFLKRKDQYASLSNLPLPGLIFMDLYMPKKDGREVLREIKADPDFQGIPIIVLSVSRSDEDIEEVYELGVSSFITKPTTFDKLVEMMKVIKSYWIDLVELPEKLKGKKYI